MKRAIIVLLAIIGLQANCQINQDSVLLRINFDAVSTIKVNYTNFKDTILLTSGFGNFFPNDYLEGESLKLYGDGIKYLRLKIQIPQKVDIRFIGFFSDSPEKDSSKTIPIKDLNATCFLVPSDTLEIEVDYAQRNLQKEAIRYIGKYAGISDYYRNKEIQFNNEDLSYRKGMLSNTAINYQSFKNTLDSLTDIELTFLNDYSKKNDLPQWFVNYENFDLRYDAFTSKMNEPAVMKLRDVVNPLPDDYFSFTKELPLNNEDAILSIYYFLSLRDYFYNCFEPSQLTNKFTGNINYLHDFIGYSITHFSPYISDILLARELDVSIKLFQVSNDDYISITNAIKSTQLKNYLEQQFKHDKNLKKGDCAPDFYLKNESNAFVSLKTFKDNVIYLCFWFAGCKPCIKGFPEENHLVDVFKNENVKIISICMNSHEDIWKQVIKEHQLKTINLFANENWGKILKEKYNIAAFPCYVLIDKNGKIIENKCLFSSQEAEQKIKNYLVNK